MNKAADPTFRSSFRDPSGNVFSRDGILLRQINEVYREHYEFLVGSGLFDTLVAKGLLVSHEEVGDHSDASSEIFKTIRPQVVPFISYPFEWSFSQLRDAAIVTLDILTSALEHGLILKDASAYNIQFMSGKPVLIDTLSFEKYRDGQPWAGYRQFCQHFIAPLSLMSYRDARLGQLLRIHIDGIPLDLASRLLPVRTWFSFGICMHLHLHARAQGMAFDGKARQRQQWHPSSSQVSRRGLFGLAESLSRLVQGMRLKHTRGHWQDYYGETNYSDEAMRHKEETVTDFLCMVRAEIPREGVVWDLGANTGRFSRIAAREGFRVVAVDGDHSAVERHYLQCRAKGATNILPLCVDLTNPTSGMGWAGEERQSLAERGPADLIMALALVHHLAIGNNVPLNRIADFLARLCSWLIIEFVPKEDSQVKTMLASRTDIFPDYSASGFEQAFSASFSLVNSRQIRDTRRKIYLWKRSLQTR